MMGTFFPGSHEAPGDYEHRVRMKNTVLDLPVGFINFLVCSADTEQRQS